MCVFDDTVLAKCKEIQRQNKSKRRGHEIGEVKGQRQMEQDREDMITLSQEVSARARHRMVCAWGGTKPLSLSREREKRVVVAQTLHNDKSIEGNTNSRKG